MRGRFGILILLLNHSLFAQNVEQGMVHPVLSSVGCDTITLLPLDNVEMLSGLFYAFVVSGDEKYLRSCRNFAASISTKAIDYSGEMALADLFVVRCDLAISGKKCLLGKYSRGDLDSLLVFANRSRSLSDTSRFIQSFISGVHQCVLPSFMRNSHLCEKVFDDLREIHNHSTRIFRFEVAYLAIRIGLMLERYDDVRFFGEWMIINYPMNFEIHLILSKCSFYKELTSSNGIGLEKLILTSSLCEVQKEHLLNRLDE